MSNYIIAGIPKMNPQFGHCLMYSCGTKERAEEVLQKVLTNDTERQYINDRKKYDNIKIAEIPDKDCWWLQGGLD